MWNERFRRNFKKTEHEERTLRILRDFASSSLTLLSADEEARAQM